MAKKFLLGLAVGFLLALASLTSAQTTTTATTTTTTTTFAKCSTGEIKCDSQCDAGTLTVGTYAACTGGSAGLSFYGTCVGAPGDKNAAGKTCGYIHCGNGAICVGGPWTTVGCGADISCASGEVCVSSNGGEGCGTGFSQCVKKCE